MKVEGPKTADTGATSQSCTARLARIEQLAHRVEERPEVVEKQLPQLFRDTMALQAELSTLPEAEQDALRHRLATAGIPLARALVARLSPVIAEAQAKGVLDVALQNRVRSLLNSLWYLYGQTRVDQAPAREDVQQLGQKLQSMAAQLDGLDGMRAEDILLALVAALSILTLVLFGPGGKLIDDRYEARLAADEMEHNIRDLAHRFTAAVAAHDQLEPSGARTTRAADPGASRNGAAAAHPPPASAGFTLRRR